MPDTRQIYGDDAILTHIEMLRTPIDPNEERAKSWALSRLELAHAIIESTAPVLGQCDIIIESCTKDAAHMLGRALRVKSVGASTETSTVAKEEK